MDNRKKLLKEKYPQENLKEKICEMYELHDKEYNRDLRKELQTKLVQLLIIETIFIALMMLFQGVNHIPFSHLTFKLNEWTFGMFINGCLIQTFILIRPICKSLFPVISKK